MKMVNEDDMREAFEVFEPIGIFWKYLNLTLCVSRENTLYWSFYFITENCVYYSYWSVYHLVHVPYHFTFSPL